MKAIEIALPGLSRIEEHADTIRAKAMELTDTWGGAMFIVSADESRRLFQALGFTEDVAAAVYRCVHDLNYVFHERATLPTGSEFTWHELDVTTLVLRGFDDPATAFVDITDETVRAHIREHRALFDGVMGAIPEYASRLMFSTRVARHVLAAFGANVSEQTLFDLALEFSGHRISDLEGRRGIATQFIRALTLTLSATLEPRETVLESLAAV
jgi:hypothetical protein